MDENRNDEEMVPCPARSCGSEGIGNCGLCGGHGEVTVSMYNEYADARGRPQDKIAVAPVFRSRRADAKPDERYAVGPDIFQPILDAVAQIADCPVDQTFLAYTGNGNWYIGAKELNSAVSVFEGHRYSGEATKLAKALDDLQNDVTKQKMRERMRQRAQNAEDSRVTAYKLNVAAITASKIGDDDA